MRRLSRASNSRLLTLAIGETADDSLLLPVTIRGEVPGRAMRGGADLAFWPPQTRSHARAISPLQISPCLQGWRCPSSGCRHLLPA
ncbi:hypothetical protein EJ071_32430 [Mesorhizobium sp. M1B.F.Ca.ET.045.04.1.1]|nr:hypothetical protein EJ071_32430 [Mesorhizobium sp. M1B.F.Ca.ET.045.04.1.1]RWB20614.1 MAG: hypothetical protein EOQ40_14895 [Mesorhizobium sp.]